METTMKCLAVLALCTGTGYTQAQTYSVTELPSLGGSSTTAAGVNSTGQVVGQATLPGDTVTHAYLYASGKTKDLGTLGGTISYGTGINDAGQATGSAGLADGVTYHAFIFSAGVMLDIGSLGGNNASGASINASGQVTGNSLLADDATTHAFYYSDGLMQDIGTLGGNASAGSSINTNGQITGNSLLSDGQTHHAFLYSNNILTDLGTVTGEDGRLESYGFAINANEQIAGGLDSFSPHSVEAFYYSNGSMESVLAPSEAVLSALNDAGVAVGSRAVFAMEPPPGIAILYSNGTVIDLQTLIDPNSPLAKYVTLTAATGISNTGFIVANGTDSRYPTTTKAFLLTEEPAAPTVESVIAGTLGSNNWYVTPTTLNWIVTGYPTPTTSGCAEVLVPDTAGKTYTCSATNSAGSAHESVPIKQDTGHPEVTITAPAQGKFYALNAKVIVSYTCSETLSGIASCKGTLKDGATLNTSKAGTFSFSVTAKDRAGIETVQSVPYGVK